MSDVRDFIARDDLTGALDLLSSRASDDQKDDIAILQGRLFRHQAEIQKYGTSKEVRSELADHILRAAALITRAPTSPPATVSSPNDLGEVTRLLQSLFSDAPQMLRFLALSPASEVVKYVPVPTDLVTASSVVAEWLVRNGHATPRFFDYVLTEIPNRRVSIEEVGRLFR